MANDPASLLEQLSGQPVRKYSTYEFGRGKDFECLSVVVGKDETTDLVFKLRAALPPGFVAFVGTSQWLGDETHSGVEVVVGRGDSQFDILRLARTDACNHDMGTEDLIRKLQSWHQTLDLDIFLAETDTIELRLNARPTDFGAFAKDVYEFCPDIVDQGIGSVEELEVAIRDYMQILLWWD
jgi:Domain of unknown function (DUF4253)